MRIFIFAAWLIFFGFNYSSLAQGFDWELSPRLPQNYSSLFFGLGGSYSHSKEFGVFSFYEKDCNCGNFSGGKSSGFSLQLTSEYWLPSGLWSLRAAAGYNETNPEFSSVSSLPININGQENFIDYENTYSGNLSYVFLNFGAKRRLFESHFYLAADLGLSFLINNKEKHIEKIVGPDWAPPFSTNPPSYSRIVAYGEIKDIYKMNVMPIISAGYDVDLGTGYYMSPAVSCALPMMNLISSGNWRRTSFSLSLSLFRWF